MWQHPAKTQKLSSCQPVTWECWTENELCCKDQRLVPTFLAGSQADQTYHLFESPCGCEHPLPFWKLPFGARSHAQCSNCAMFPFLSTLFSCRLYPPRCSTEDLGGMTPTVPFLAFWQWRSGPQEPSHSFFCFVGGGADGWSLVAHIYNKGVTTFQMWCTVAWGPKWVDIKCILSLPFNEDYTYWNNAWNRFPWVLLGSFTH